MAAGGFLEMHFAERIAGGWRIREGLPRTGVKEVEILARQSRGRGSLYRRAICEGENIS